MFVKLILQVDTEYSGVRVQNPHEVAIQMVKDALVKSKGITILEGHTSCFNFQGEDNERGD